MWVFHIGSASGLDQVIPASVGRGPSLPVEPPESSPVDPDAGEGDYPDAEVDYPESFYDGPEDDFEYSPLAPTELAPEAGASAGLHPEDQFDYRGPGHPDARLDVGLEPTLPPPESHHPYPQPDPGLRLPAGEEAPPVPPSASEGSPGTPPWPLVPESPVEAVTAVLLGRPGHGEAPRPWEEGGGVRPETESSPLDPEEEVLLGSFPDQSPPFSPRRRVVAVDEDVGFNPDGESLRGLTGEPPTSRLGSQAGSQATCIRSWACGSAWGAGGWPGRGERPVRSQPGPTSPGEPPCPDRRSGVGGGGGEGCCGLGVRLEPLQEGQKWGGMRRGGGGREGHLTHQKPPAVLGES